MRARRPPGILLSKIARAMFDGDSAAQSLEALIADAQCEWRQREGTDAVRTHLGLLLAFWQSLLGHSCRRILIPTAPTLRITGWIFAGYFVGLLLTIVFKSSQPTFSLPEAIADGFVYMSTGATLCFHPANIARRFPLAPQRGWWPLSQFLVIWLGCLLGWQLATGGSLWRVAAALAFTAMGAVVAKHLYAHDAPSRP